MDGEVRLGLSPRVRGNLVLPDYEDALRRSIPACAGEPGDGRGRRRHHRVYPRVCGGTAGGFRQSRPLRGLSPRVRGNLVPIQAVCIPYGSIPACAGEPKQPGTAPGYAAVYPRVCGGTRIARAQRKRVIGLSPRVRGNPATWRDVSRVARSIPACAGEPRRRPRPRAAGWVYPRVCGGTGVQPSTVSRRPGLSPRVRGNPTAGHQRASRRRSIPACAGEPRAVR